MPSWFTWLIPKSGLHLPAALIHDGLVVAPGEPQTYVADHEIPRATADQIFRDGMRDLGTSLRPPLVDVDGGHARDPVVLRTQAVVPHRDDPRDSD